MASFYCYDKFLLYEWFVIDKVDNKFCDCKALLDSHMFESLL